MTERGAAREVALPYTARVQMTPLALIAVIGVCVSLLLLAARPRGAGGVVITALLVCLWLGVGALLLWFGSYRVTLLPDRVRYLWLGGAREIAYSELRAVTLERVGPATESSERPPNVLALRGATDDSALLISVRPFHERDLTILLDAIAQLAPHATLDASVQARRVGQGKP
ncbi:MAG TPA: hypothetical protein VJN88_06985 [Ktedonobacterales bacterium]|nr:hypothetical protein [Ktedonobacterales bacterium]